MKNAITNKRFKKGNQSPNIVYNVLPFNNGAVTLIPFFLYEGNSCSEVPQAEINPEIAVLAHRTTNLLFSIALA